MRILGRVSWNMHDSLMRCQDVFSHLILGAVQHLTTVTIPEVGFFLPVAARSGFNMTCCVTWQIQMINQLVADKKREKKSLFAFELIKYSAVENCAVLVKITRSLPWRWDAVGLNPYLWKLPSVCDSYISVICTNSGPES